MKTCLAPFSLNAIWEVEGKLKESLCLSPLLLLIFNWTVANSYEGLHSGRVVFVCVCEFVKCCESISNQLINKVGNETDCRLHKQLLGFMLSVEHSFLSSEVDSLPRSVRADLQNQSQEEKHNRIPGGKKLDWKEMEGGKVKGKKSNKYIYSMEEWDAGRRSLVLKKSKIKKI